MTHSTNTDECFSVHLSHAPPPYNTRTTYPSSRQVLGERGGSTW
jgi:hypothetical protein